MQPTSFRCWILQVVADHRKVLVLVPSQHQWFNRSPSQQAQSGVLPEDSLALSARVGEGMDEKWRNRHTHTLKIKTIYSERNTGRYCYRICCQNGIVWDLTPSLHVGRQSGESNRRHHAPDPCELSLPAKLLCWVPVCATFPVGGHRSITPCGSHM